MHSVYMFHFFVFRAKQVKVHVAYFFHREQHVIIAEHLTQCKSLFQSDSQFFVSAAFVVS